MLADDMTPLTDAIDVRDFSSVRLRRPVQQLHEYTSVACHGMPKMD